MIVSYNQPNSIKIKSGRQSVRVAHFGFLFPCLRGQRSCTDDVNKRCLRPPQESLTSARKPDCEEHRTTRSLAESGGGVGHLCREASEAEKEVDWRGAHMAGFLDNFRWPEWECIDWGERRNALASVVAGVLVRLFHTQLKFKLRFIRRSNHKI